ncbi:MAG TPA: RHS repeat-associated core domain-containing protein [Fimbriimonadaceae bacterium]|nr:RHS repeat-associated core domain-containing protein [Fimbriimonadaceae bacterium]
MKNADSQSGTGQTLGASRQYDAFGNLTASYGTWKGPFGYAGAFGYQEDPDSTLKLLGHRYYDSSIGRFLTRDPAKDGRNWYAYCANGPVGLIDPVGYGAIAIGVEGEAVLSIPFIKPIEISFRYGVGVIYDSEKGWGGYTDGGIGIGFGESVHLLVAMEGLADAESGNQIQWNFGGGSGGYGQVSVVTPVANGKIAGIDGGGFGFGVGEGLSLSIAAVHRSILWIDDISGEGGGGSPPNIYDIWPTQQDWISYLQ